MFVSWASSKESGLRTTSVVVPLAILAAILLFGAIAGGLSSQADRSILLVAAVPLLVAAVAQSQVILAGGQGLAAGSIVFLVNVVAAVWIEDNLSSILLWSSICIALGAAIGAINGFFVGYRRLPSTAVTLATGLAIGGFALQLTSMQRFDERSLFRGFATGNLPGDLPVPAVLVVLLLGVAAYLDRSRFGNWIRSAGRQRLARQPHVAAAPTFAAYVFAGVGQAAGGLFLAAAIGPSDGRGALMVSGPVLLEIYAAVLLGGSVPALRQGSVVGAALGAIAIAAFLKFANDLGWPFFVGPVFTGIVLLGVVLLARRTTAMTATEHQSPSRDMPALSYPLYAAVLIGLAFATGPGLLNIDPLTILVATLMVAAVGLVIMTGRVDLSLPVITICAAFGLLHLTRGSDAALAWVVPLVVLGGALVGLTNILISSAFKVSLLLVTLAVSGILMGVVSYLEMSVTFFDYTPLSLPTLLMNGPNGASPVVLAICALPLAPLLLFLRPRVHDWLRNPRNEGVVDIATLAIHGFAGACCAAIGVLQANASDQPASALLLPALLAAQLAAITLGRRGGSPLMMVLTTPIVILIQILLGRIGMSLPMQMTVLGCLLICGIALTGSARSGEGRSGQIAVRPPSTPNAGQS